MPSNEPFKVGDLARHVDPEIARVIHGQITFINQASGHCFISNEKGEKHAAALSSLERWSLLDALAEAADGPLR